MKHAKLRPMWDLPITAFRWDARAALILDAHNYNYGTKRVSETTIRDLSKTGPDRLRRIRGCGDKTIRYIANTVCAYDPHAPKEWMELMDMEPQP